MKNVKILFLMFLININLNCLSQNSNLENLITNSQWDLLFPKRAGTNGTHPQGYTSDFYSYDNLIQAIDEMSDYLVQIRLKEGVWGQLITVTIKSTNESYIYSDVESSWHSNSTTETVITVDFEHFVNRLSDLNNKRELAAFLANISKETTGGWQMPVGGGSEGDYAQFGLYFVHELGYTTANSAGTYSQSHPEYPPNPLVGYYGRGPIQLSWNFNYGQFSKFLYNDINVLINNPNLLQEDGKLAFKSAIWFWMMPQCPKPSCHQVMHDLFDSQSSTYTSSLMYKKGFAHTNNIINGGLECRTFSSAAFTEKVVIRSEIYKYYLNIMGLTNSQIDLENEGNYSTLCYESTSNAMEDYQSCSVIDEVVSNSEFALTELSIYPNPTSDILTISNSSDIQQLELIGPIGEIVHMWNVRAKKFELNISKNYPGLYLIRIYSDHKVYTSRVLITSKEHGK